MLATFVLSPEERFCFKNNICDYIETLIRHTLSYSKSLHLLIDIIHRSLFRFKIHCGFPDSLEFWHGTKATIIQPTHASSVSEVLKLIRVQMGHITVTLGDVGSI